MTDASGSEVTGAAFISGSSQNSNLGPHSLALDHQGDVYVLGNTSASDFITTPGAYVSPLRSAPCYTGRLTGYLNSSDIFVIKLRGQDMQQVYSALLGGQCGSEPGEIFVDSTGAVTISLSSGPAFPLSNAVVDQSVCPLPWSLSFIGRKRRGFTIEPGWIDASVFDLYRGMRRTCNCPGVRWFNLLGIELLWDAGSPGTGCSIAATRLGRSAAIGFSDRSDSYRSLWARPQTIWVITLPRTSVRRSLRPWCR